MRIQFRYSQRCKPCILSRKEIRRKRRSLQECYNFQEFGPGGFEVVEEAILIEAAGMAVVLESQGLCGLAMDRRRREKEAIAVVTMGCAGEKE